MITTIQYNDKLNEVVLIEILYSFTYTYVELNWILLDAKYEHYGASTEISKIISVVP